ncbi:MAG TPA: Gfo/Idh/MocA family oxidoreductase [Micromonosporaceae bacterium]|nr:Gfo/Idh/MocA family oxidoreductase [Micromonosporaceae bacterium]
MRRSRIGLVGAGNVAQRHARELAAFDDVRLAGVTDVVPEAAWHLAGAHGMPAFADLPALLEADLDAVYVCVPPFAHGPVEEAVLGAGLPMFVEKPLAVDLPTAEHIAAAIEARGVVTAVGHHWRYLNVVERARQLLAGRPVRLVSGAWLDRVPPVAWWAQAGLSGGPVVEQAVHVLDLARLLAGEVAQVQATAAGAAPEGGDVATATAATLRFASGAVGTLTTTCALGWKHRAGLEVYADRLAIALAEDGLVARDGDREHRLAGDPAAARTAVDRAFIDAVRGNGAGIRAGYADALRTHRLACAVAQAATDGGTVRLDHATPDRY